MRAAQPKKVPAWAVPPLLIGVALLMAVRPVPAQEGFQPAIALIIDDLGNQRQSGLRAVNLPGPVTFAILPMTPHARLLAERAHQGRKEIMLHLPMQSVEEKALGPGGLTLDMTRGEFTRTLEASLASVPHVAGINNHMGSLLTRHPGHMDWLMQVLSARGGLFFVDSRTTHHTVAFRMAEERRVPYIQRDVFLDGAPHDPVHVRSQWRQLVQRAKDEGLAVGIAHPYPETLDVLEKTLGTLDQEGVRLLTVSRLLAEKERRELWRASLSHSPKAARN